MKLNKTKQNTCSLAGNVWSNLGSVLKSRDITLPTKVHLVKAMVFPVVYVWMWELDSKESWVLKNWFFWTQFTSVQFSCSVMSNSLWPHESQHARPPCPSPAPRVHSDSCPSHWWCHPTISSSVIPFSCLQSFPASFQMSQFFASGGQSIGVSASASVLSMNIQDWFPLGWTGWISLQSKGLSRVFPNITIQKHQFFSIQLSL